MSVVGNGKAVTEELTESVGSSVARLRKSKPAIASIAQPVAVRDEDVYDDGYLRVEHQNYYLTCGGEPVYLPRVEFLLISRLARSIERVVTSEDLWRAAWAQDKPLNDASLHVYIHRLRNSLRPYSLRIEALVNVGYRLLTNK